MTAVEAILFSGDNSSLAAVSTALLAAPVALPAIVTTIAGYVAVGAGVMTAVSQTAVKNDKD